MMNRIIKMIMRAGCVAWVLLLSNCSLFPDKEKQYLQNSELAPLELPSDLQQNLEAEVPDTALNQANELNQQVPEISTEDEDISYATETEEDQIPMLVDMIDHPIHIQIFESLEQAWRTVGKTLAHMGLEVLDRDEDNGQYFVVYEVENKPVDDSLWSFIAFWRDDDQHEEYDFRVKLLPDGNTASVLILDADEQPVVDGPGRELLNKIYRAL